MSVFPTRLFTVNRMQGCGLLMLLILSAVSGCSTGIPGNGISTSEVRSLGAFDEIRATGIGDLEVHYGDKNEVVVTVDENLVDYVSTEIEDGVLRLKTTENINAQLGVHYDVTVTELSAISISGVGDLDLHEARGEVLELKVSGVGSIVADGQVKDLKVRVSGVGDANLKNLVAETANVRVSGTGNATVFATQSADARVSGVGGIDVFGEPENRVKKVSGLGNVNFK